MADSEVIHTVFGKNHKFDVVKVSSLFGSPKFYVRKDGKPFKGSYSSLADAVEAAEDEG